MNNVLGIVASLLQTLAVVTRNPAIGIDLSDVGTLLDLIARLTVRGSEAITELQALTIEVNAMVAEQRKPTAEEMGSWKARSDAAHAALQSMKSADPFDSQE